MYPTNFQATTAILLYNLPYNSRKTIVSYVSDCRCELRERYNYNDIRVLCMLLLLYPVICK